MANNKSTQNAKHDVEDAARDSAEDAKQLAHGIAEYVKEYARENPGTAALWCLGIGFVLGWKMKPW